MSALKQGQARYRREQQRAAVQRVRAFHRWVRSGCNPAKAPAVLPTDHDFKIAKAAAR